MKVCEEEGVQGGVRCITSLCLLIEAIFRGHLHRLCTGARTYARAHTHTRTINANVCRMHLLDDAGSYIYAAIGPTTAHLIGWIAGA